MSRASASAGILSDRIRRIVIEQSKRANVGHIGSALSSRTSLAALYGGVLQVDGPATRTATASSSRRATPPRALRGAARDRRHRPRRRSTRYCADGSLLGVASRARAAGSRLLDRLARPRALDRRRRGARRAARRARRGARSCCVSDAECNEGSVWEAVMFAAHHRLANLVAIVDVNGQQALGYTRDVLDLDAARPSAGARSAGTSHEVDGHDVDAHRGDDRPGSTPTTARRTCSSRRRRSARASRTWRARSSGTTCRCPTRVRARRSAELEARAPMRSGVRRRRSSSSPTRDPRVVLLTGDLGFMALEPFAERFPDRFFNVGVAEQNMVGIATGLAEAGLRPVRLLDRHVRVAAAVRVHPQRPGAAPAAGAHRRRRRRLRLRAERPHALRARGHGGDARAAGAHRDRPGRRPADRERRRGDATIAGPAYLRLARTGPAIAELDGRFAAGPRRTCSARAPTWCSSRSATWPPPLWRRRLCSPPAAWRRVSSSSRACARPRRTISWPRLPASRSRSRSNRTTWTAELGSLTAEVVAENGLATRLVRAGVRRSPGGETGSSEFLHDLHGLSARALAQSALDHLARRPGPLRHVA